MNDDVFRPGELCGTYRVIKLLGRGGFADVYQAIDLATQQKVALKCLQLRHLTNAQITQRMVAETELLSGLDHPNVIQVEDAGINGGVLWLAMEYISGGTLRERLRKARGPLPLLAALKYARQVASGVGAAHGMHVVHRDLKPENIMITDKDEVKVLDLGAAKFFGKELTLTSANAAIGTPLYMAPEQIKGEVVDARTDVYALGTILYEMIAGRHPFAQPTGELPPAFEIGTLQLHAQPKPLTDIVGGLPEYVWRVVERALAKDAARRFASMNEFESAIAEARRRVLDDPSAGKAVFVPPALRVARYAEPSEVASASDHHSGIRDLSPVGSAPADLDALFDDPGSLPAAQAEGARGAPTSRAHSSVPGWSDLVPASDDLEAFASRAAAGSARIARMQAGRAPSEPRPAFVEPAASAAPAAVSGPSAWAEMSAVAEPPAMAEPFVMVAEPSVSTDAPTIAKPPTALEPPGVTEPTFITEISPVAGTPTPAAPIAVAVESPSSNAEAESLHTIRSAELAVVMKAEAEPDASAADMEVAAEPDAPEASRSEPASNEPATIPTLAVSPEASSDIEAAPSLEEIAPLVPASRASSRARPRALWAATIFAAPLLVWAFLRLAPTSVATTAVSALQGFAAPPSLEIPSEPVVTPSGPDLAARASDPSALDRDTSSPASAQPSQERGSSARPVAPIKAPVAVSQRAPSDEPGSSKCMRGLIFATKDHPGCQPPLTANAAAR